MKHAHLVSLEAAASVEEAARRNHYEGEAVTESFWKKAAASLPPHVQRRYGHLFEAAEQYEPVIGWLVDSCVRAGNALGRIFKHRESGRSTRARHSSAKRWAA